MDVEIRTAAENDVAAITEIYNQAIELRSATADTTPVSVDSRRTWLAEHAPAEYPVYVAVEGGTITGWCSLSPYRPGRMALRHTAEISYYIHEAHRGRGIGFRLISHTLAQCPGLGFKVVFAILLDVNRASANLLEKLGFEEWGRMPGVASFDGVDCGHLYYGRRVG